MALIHSYSSLSTWEQCPRRWHAQYVTRTARDSGSEATRRGEVIHKEIEDYLTGKRAARPAVTPPDDLLEKLRGMGSRVSVELPLAIRRDGTPCDFWDKTGWLRGKLDVVVDLDDTIAVLDWKGLTLDTPLPGPDGWVQMADVKEGHRLFDQRGNICMVVGVSNVKRVPIVRLWFDDKSTVVCDMDHKWVLTDGSVVDTRDLRRGSLIPVAGPLEYPAKDLPIDPYVLGLWIADGKHTSGEITKPDGFVWEEMARRGYSFGNDTSASDHCPTRTVLGIRGALRSMNLHGNKHIPDIYMQASIEQRIDLVRGLMDGDGNANPTRKQAVFTTCDPNLSWQVYELLSGLGQRVNRATTKQRGFGLEVTAYPLAFRPQGFNPFLNPVKADRIDPAWGAGWSWRRRLESITPEGMNETRCIAVDSPDNTYLCTRAMIPTHNSGKRNRGAKFQAQVYSTLAQHYWPGRAVTITFDYLNNGRDKPVVGEPTDPDVVRQVATAAEQATEFVPRPTPLCRWCPVTNCEFNERDS